MTDAPHALADELDLTNMTLKRYLERFGPLTYIECADLLRQSAGLLQDIHKERGFHGTLGVVQITVSRVDGGLRVLGFDEPTLGAYAMVPTYTAPERVSQIMEETEDERRGAPADLYALGLLAYTSLLGQLPPELSQANGRPLRKLLEHIMGSELVRLPEDEDRPQGLTDIIHKLLEKDLSKRYSNCQDLLHDLETTWNRSF